MTVAFVQATRDQILSIEPQPLQDDPKTMAYGSELFRAGGVQLAGRAVAVLDNGFCLGAYGWILFWPGVSRAWALFSQVLLDEYPTVLARHVLHDLEHGEQDLKLHRIEATVTDAHSKAVAFLEWLDFRCEGLMRHYGPDGQDYWLYARTHDVA